MQKEDHLLTLAKRIRNNNGRLSLVELELDSMKDQIAIQLKEFTFLVLNALEKANKNDNK